MSGLIWSWREKYLGQSDWVPKQKERMAAIDRSRYSLFIFVVVVGGIEPPTSSM